ncbi:MAG: exosortase/archaeosortase family protein, partial [Chloroflexota bacterium]
MGATHARTLRWLAATWLGSPYYSHGLLVPLIAGLLAWYLWRRLAPFAPPQAPPTRGAALVGALVVALSLAAHLLGLRRGQWLISATSLVVLVAGVTLTLAGRAALRRYAFPIAFLLFMIPLPWLEQWTPHLARAMAAAARALVLPLGVAATVQGARIELPELALVIGAPCSGVNSLAALVTLAALYAYLVRGPLIARIALAVLAVPVALLANLTRRVVILLLARYIGG